MAIMTSKGRVVCEAKKSSQNEQINNVSDDDSGDKIEGNSDDESELENENEVDESNEDELESDGDNENESGNEKEVDVSSEDDVESDAGEEKSNAAWADAIGKILKTTKPKGKKTLVLSRAKKLTEVKPKPKLAGFEVATEDGEVKKEIAVSSSDEDDKPDRPPRKKRREYPSVRVKPDILQKDRERTLSKIATKGVVQLFNTVRMQQKDIDHKLKEAGPLEVKRDKVLKNIDRRAFLDVLMGEKSQPVDPAQETVKIPEKLASNKPTWSVLRDDFMMDAKLKDWDKQLEDEDEENEPVEMEID